MKNNFLLVSLAAFLVAAFVYAEDVIELDIDLGEMMMEDDDVIDLTEEIERLETEPAPSAPEEEGIEIVEGDLEKYPEILEFVEAEYPEELVTQGIEGTVLFEILISETGVVDSITVIRSLHPALDTLALEAVRKFKFSPARAEGEDVAVMLLYEYRFSLRDVVNMPETYVNFTGRVLERGTRRPVSDVLVVLKLSDVADERSLGMPVELYMEQIGNIEGQTFEDGLLIASTDSLGNFKFYSLPTCKAEVRILSPEYEAYSTSESIGRHEEVSAVYYIARLDYSGYELVVYGKTEEKEVSRRQLAIAEVKRIPGLGGEALRVVQAMPGVTRAAFGSNSVAVRGLPSWATLNIIDGINVPLLYHLGGNSSSYPSEAVEAVDFYPGGFSTRYGGTTGGVVEMRSRKPKTDRIQGYADLSNLDGALFVEGPINERLSFMASARRGFAGDLMSFYFENFDPTGLGIVAAPFYWDFLLRTDVKIDKDNDVFVKLIGSRDSLGVFVPIAQSGTQEIDAAMDEMNIKILFYTLIGGWDSRINDRWKNSLRISGSHIGQSMSVLGMAKMDQTELHTSIRNEVGYKASDKLTVNVGVDLNVSNVNMDITTVSAQNDVIRTGINGDNYGNMGVYSYVEWRPIDRLLLVPGIRYDHYINLDYEGSVVPALWNYGFMNNRRGGSGEPALRVSGRYEYMDDHTIKAAVGTYSQQPEPMGFVTHELIGEPDLPSTKAAHYVVGYEWRINDLLHLDAQAYYNNMWDVARSYSAETDYDPALGYYQKNFFPDDRGRTYGLELMLRHNRSEKFFGWVSYTLSRSQSWSKLENEWILSNRDEPHHLQLLGSWRLPKNWEVGTRLRYVSGKPTTPVVATSESENNKSYSAVYGRVNSERNDPFFQVDVRADRRYVYKKWMLTYYVDLQNILWPLYKSPEYTFYNYNYTESQKISMIPMVASGVKVEF